MTLAGIYIGKENNTQYKKCPREAVPISNKPKGKWGVKCLVLLIVAAETVLIWCYGYGLICDIEDEEHYGRGSLALLSWRLMECTRDDTNWIHHLGIVIVTFVINVEILIFHYCLHMLVYWLGSDVPAILDVCVFGASLGWTTLTFHKLVDENLASTPPTTTLIYPWMQVLSIHNYGTVLLLVSLLAINVSIMSVEMLVDGMMGERLAHILLIIIYSVALLLFVGVWNNSHDEIICIWSEFIAVTAIQGMVVVSIFAVLDIDHSVGRICTSFPHRLGEASLIFVVSALIAAAPADNCSL